MNKAIVICYTGQAIGPDAVSAIQQIISGTCDADPENSVIVTFDEESIAKALLKKSAESMKISFDEGKKEADLIAEARKKAVLLIKSNYGGPTGPLRLAKDIALAKYHNTVNCVDDAEKDLLNAIDVIADMPSKVLAATSLSISQRETILKMKDM